MDRKDKLHETIPEVIGVSDTPAFPGQLRLFLSLYCSPRVRALPGKKMWILHAVHDA